MKSAELLVLGCLVVGAARASAQSYSIDWHTIDGGGGTSTGGGYAMSGTIGQFGAGALSGGGFALDGGFWGAGQASPAALFDNTAGINNGVVLATTTNWLAGKLCLGSQSFGLGSVTLLLSSQEVLGSPQPSTVRLQLYAADPVSAKPSTSTGVTMNLSGAANPITLPLGTDDVRVKWIPAAPFTLAANNCYWVVLSVDDGASVWQTASVTMPTGAAATFGRAQSLDQGATWSDPDNASNLKMLIQGNAISPGAPVIGAVGISENALHFSFPTSAGRSYALESRFGFGAGVWAEVLGSRVTSTGADFHITLPINQSQAQQFFRVKQLP